MHALSLTLVPRELLDVCLQTRQSLCDMPAGSLLVPLSRARKSADGCAAITDIFGMGNPSPTAFSYFSIVGEAFRLPLFDLHHCSVNRRTRDLCQFCILHFLARWRSILSLLQRGKRQGTRRMRRNVTQSKFFSSSTASKVALRHALPQEKATCPLASLGQINRAKLNPFGTTSTAGGFRTQKKK